MPDIAAKPGNSAYHQDGRGAILRSQHGLCWRTGYWTPQDAVAGCDGPLAPPVASIIAPPVEPGPEPTVTAPPEVVTAPPPLVVAKPVACDFSVTLTNDEAFGFNRADLSSTARKRIDRELLARLGRCARIDSILVTGHTDRLGSVQYNQRLSQKRANAVTRYLKTKGINTRFEAVGAGASQPVQECESSLARPRLLACLAPNRRVEIAVRGLAE